MRPNPPLKRYRHLCCPTPSWDFGCESMIRTRRVAFAQSGHRVSARDKREAFAGRSSTKTLDPDPIQSNRIRICCAREQPAISRFIACLCRQPNYRTDNRSHRGPSGHLPALRQNAKNKTPAPWAIRSPGRFLRRRPAAKQPTGGLMAGSLTLLRSGVGSSPAKSTAQANGPSQLLASPRVRPVALPVHAIERRAITVSPLCADQ